MTTPTRPTTHIERSERLEWVVEAATGRVVRREAAHLFHQAADSVSDAIRQAVTNIEPRESDVRVVRPIEDSRTVTSPGSEQPVRPAQARSRRDGRSLNRDQRGA